MIPGKIYEISINSDKKNKKIKMKFLEELNNEIYLFKHPRGYKECFLKKLNNIDYKLKEC